MVGAYRTKSSAAQQAFGRDRAREAQRTPDVLLVNHVVGQRDPTAESGAETVWLGVVAKQVDQLPGRAVGEVGDGDAR